MTTRPTFDPFSPADWAKAIGLVHVPLFGPARTPPNGRFGVLLDGKWTSLAFCSADDLELAHSPDPLAWSWSANLRHTVILNSRSGFVLHRRWDDPGFSKRYRVPGTRADANKIFDDIERTRQIETDNVIGHMLKAFRGVRSILRPRESAVDAVLVFNAFLVGTEKVRLGQFDVDAWRAIKTIGEVWKVVAGAGLEPIPEELFGVPVNELPSDFYDPDPLSGCWLEPDLLIRHASGILYQEAHLELERTDAYTFSLFRGYGDELPYKGNSRRDARFTPPGLARALVEQSFHAARDDSSSKLPLKILDPACGSGVFLLDAIKELETAGHQGAVEVIGYDVSDVSCAIARFCVGRAARDAAGKFDTKVTISHSDALLSTWDTADIILTNPPFGAWKKMPADERTAVYRILGDRFRGHADKSMAFLLKAIQTVPPGGTVGAIVPSPLLESDAGQPLRQHLSEQAHLSLVGRFTGYDYFLGAMVEPGFVVLKKKRVSDERPLPVRVVMAGAGHQEKALRATRTGGTSHHRPELDFYLAAPDMFTSASWFPRSRRALEMVEKLRLSSVARVGDLFDVKQGTLTGNNKVFLLTVEEYENLPPEERPYFRPTAGTPTIRECRIYVEEYVFFPYRENGIIIVSTEDLKIKLPKFYEQRILPNEKALRDRARRTPDNWWQLTEPRRWQHQLTPKIVTEYFGEMGSFAYDAKGQFVVRQGYGWFWKKPALEDISPQQPEELAEEVPVFDFDRSDLPWAYLAILNSGPFQLLLGNFCPRVQGGQFNLSDRFMSKVFIPDLSDPNMVSGDIVLSLARYGRTLAQGEAVDLGAVARLVANAYGMPVESFEPDR